jgi:hypothetical protein
MMEENGPAALLDTDEQVWIEKKLMRQDVKFS